MAFLREGRNGQSFGTAGKATTGKLTQTHEKGTQCLPTWSMTSSSTDASLHAPDNSCRTLCACDLDLLPSTSSRTNFSSVSSRLGNTGSGGWDILRRTGQNQSSCVWDTARTQQKIRRDVVANAQAAAGASMDLVGAARPRKQLTSFDVRIIPPEARAIVWRMCCTHSHLSSDSSTRQTLQHGRETRQRRAPSCIEEVAGVLDDHRLHSQPHHTNRTCSTPRSETNKWCPGQEQRQFATWSDGTRRA